MLVLHKRRPNLFASPTLFLPTFPQKGRPGWRIIWTESISLEGSRSKHAQIVLETDIMILHVGRKQKVRTVASTRNSDTLLGHRKFDGDDRTQAETDSLIQNDRSNAIWIWNLRVRYIRLDCEHAR
jgi:hypothetical protein